MGRVPTFDVLMEQSFDIAAYKAGCAVPTQFNWAHVVRRIWVWRDEKKVIPANGSSRRSVFCSKNSMEGPMDEKKQESGPKIDFSKPAGPMGRGLFWCGGGCRRHLNRIFLRPGRIWLQRKADRA
jgi:hypothetical protein